MTMEQQQQDPDNSVLATSQPQTQPSSSDLPPHWERMVGDNGKIYFSNHKDRTTTFTNPVTGEAEPNLLYAVGTGRPYWVDHVNKTTRWADTDEEWNRRNA